MIDLNQIKNDANKVWKFKIRKSVDQPKEIDIIQNGEYIRFSSNKYNRYVELKHEFTDFDLLCALDYLVTINAQY